LHTLFNMPSAILAPCKRKSKKFKKSQKREQFGSQNLLPCYTEAAAGGRPTPVFIDAKMGSPHWTAIKRRRCEITVSDIYNHHRDR